MEVILLEKVGRLGNVGDKVKVKAGYSRNYLVPFGKAVPATGANVEAFEQRRAQLEAAAQEKLSNAQVRAQRLAELKVTIPAHCGDEGKLFGSVGTRDIADAITNAGVEVSKAEVRLPEGAIRQIGEYDVAIQLHSDVSQDVKVVVVPE